MTIRNLLEDLVVEILSRVPAVSLARLRSTCKRWNALIKDGRVLAKKHSANAPSSSTIALVLIDDRLYLMRFGINRIHNKVSSVNVTFEFSLKDPLSNNSSEVVDIRNVFHCDGLLLCRTKDYRLVVWNPCSEKTRWIQPRNSYKEFDFFALSYDNKSSCYKILRVHRFRDGNIAEYEIYDFTSNSWRAVGKTRDWFISIEGYTHGISLNGHTYWLASTNQGLGLQGSYFLQSYDFSKERFGSVSLPEDVINPLALSVTGQGQQLCMLSFHIPDVYVTNVWVATKSESTGAMSWSKFLIVHGFDPSYRLHYRIGMSFLANVDKDKEFVLSCNKPNRYSENIIHVTGCGNYTKLDHHGAKPTHESPTPFLFSYVPSLVQIQHGI